MTAVKTSSEARGNTRLVLVMIADRADDYGIAWPGIQSLTEDCKIGRATVVRAIDTLVNDLGELERYNRKRRGQQTSNVYRILLPGIKAMDADAIEHLSALIGEGRAEAQNEHRPEAQIEHQPRLKMSLKTEVGNEIGSSLRSEPRTRALSLSESIADQHLEVLKPKLASGYGFDIADEVTRVWSEAWQQAAATEGGNPIATGLRVAAFLFGSITGEEANYSQLGRLVRRFGKLSCVGIVEAITHEIPAEGFLPYATRVCENRKREIEARRATREET